LPAVTALWPASCCVARFWAVSPQKWLQPGAQAQEYGHETRQDCRRHTHPGPSAPQSLVGQRRVAYFRLARGPSCRQGQLSRFLVSCLHVRSDARCGVAWSSTAGSLAACPAMPRRNKAAAADGDGTARREARKSAAGGQWTRLQDHDDTPPPQGAAGQGRLSTASLFETQSTRSYMDHQTSPPSTHQARDKRTACAHARTSQPAH
jgi:hypothetical protein